MLERDAALCAELASAPLPVPFRPVLCSLGALSFTLYPHLLHCPLLTPARPPARPFPPLAAQIECSSIIDQARLIVEANGYSDGPSQRRVVSGVRAFRGGG